MLGPIFLTLTEVLELHAYQIEHFGGDGAVLNLGLLESAIAQPRQSFAGKYLHEDIAMMAAAYLYHITLNHPFADGNKRAGAHAAYAFLRLNGFDLPVAIEEAEALVIGVACGTTTKEEVAEFFRAQGVVTTE
jgi:death-on-curing protein